MTQTQENTTAMFEATIKFLDENNNNWSGKPAFAEAVSEAKGGVQAIRNAASTQENVTVGVRDQKAQSRSDLEDQTLEIADQLAAFAAKTGEANLSANAQVTRSSLDQSQDNDLIQTAQRIHDLANANAKGLEPYGVTADQIQLLKAAVLTFDGLRTGSRTAVADRRSATGSVGDLIKTTRSLFRNQIDKIVTPFRKSAPEFYSGYFAARVIVDRAATRSAVKPPAPPNPNPMPSITSEPATAKS
jgi:hypothetical protein